MALFTSRYKCMTILRGFELIMSVLLMAGKTCEMPCAEHSDRYILQSVRWTFYPLFPRAGSNKDLFSWNLVINYSSKTLIMPFFCAFAGNMTYISEKNS